MLNINFLRGTGQPPPQRMIWPPIPVIPRLRHPVLEAEIKMGAQIGSWWAVLTMGEMPSG